jgi:hypothetical protein
MPVRISGSIRVPSSAASASRDGSKDILLARKEACVQAPADQTGVAKRATFGIGVDDQLGCGRSIEERRNPQFGAAVAGQGFEADQRERMSRFERCPRPIIGAERHLLGAAQQQAMPLWRDGTQ